MVKRNATMGTILKQCVTSYVAAAIVMLALDAIWLNLAATRLYRPRIGEIMLDGFRPGPAVAFYLLYVCGIVVFAL